MSGEGNFAGYAPRDCGEHRTVGTHRAWCLECSMWCYPDHDGDTGARCNGCRIPALVAHIALLEAEVAKLRAAAPAPIVPDAVPDERPMPADPLAPSACSSWWVGT